MPLFLIHIYPAKLTGAATRSTRSTINIFFMVVLYVGGRVVVEVDVIQHKRVTCVEEGGGFYSTHPLDRCFHPRGAPLPRVLCRG